MGIPRKGSRFVEADGKRYRYLVKGTTIPDHPDQKSFRVVVQEDAEHPGRVMRAHYFYYEVLGPVRIQALIREARSLGWDPRDRGAAFDMPANRSQGRYDECDPSSYR